MTSARTRGLKTSLSLKHLTNIAVAIYEQSQQYYLCSIIFTLFIINVK